MATSKNPFLKEVTGTVDKTTIVKHYSNNRNVLSKYPDMSRVKPSQAQLLAKSNFAQAVAYAKETINNFEKKTAASVRLSRRKGTLYHALISEYIATNKQEK